MMELRPSEIFFSQATVKDHFRRGFRTIYATLEQCMNDPDVINDIPKITVCRKDGKWFTLDNRRLWVFRQLEITSPTPSPSANITQRMVAHLWRFWNGENDSIWQPWFLNLNTCANFKKLVHFVKLCRDLPIFIIHLCYFCARKILFIAFWLYWPY